MDELFKLQKLVSLLYGFNAYVRATVDSRGAVIIIFKALDVELVRKAGNGVQDWASFKNSNAYKDMIRYLKEETRRKIGKNTQENVQLQSLYEEL